MAILSREERASILLAAAAIRDEEQQPDLAAALVAIAGPDHPAERQVLKGAKLIDCWLEHCVLEGCELHASHIYAYQQRVEHDAGVTPP